MNANPIRITDEQGIRDFYEAFTASDFATMRRMMHPDCVLEFPGSSFPNLITGRDSIMGLFEGVQAVMAGSLKFHIKWAMHQPQASAGDLIAAHWYTTGVTATGGRYINRGVAWYRLEDGLIREFMDFFDTEIIGSFFDNGQPTTDFARANALVGRLRAYAFADAVARFDSFN